jgi:hypothetical protein
MDELPNYTGLNVKPTTETLRHGGTRISPQVNTNGRESMRQDGRHALVDYALGFRFAFLRGPNWVAVQFRLLCKRDLKTHPRPTLHFRRMKKPHPTTCHPDRRGLCGGGTCSAVASREPRLIVLSQHRDALLLCCRCKRVAGSGFRPASSGPHAFKSSGSQPSAAEQVPPPQKPAAIGMTRGCRRPVKIVVRQVHLYANGTTTPNWVFAPWLCAAV